MKTFPCKLSKKDDIQFLLNLSNISYIHCSKSGGLVFRNPSLREMAEQEPYKVEVEDMPIKEGVIDFGKT